MGLENYFNNDNWVEYVKCFEDNWLKNKNQSRLLELCNNHKDIAMVVYFHFGNSESWLNNKVPALNYLTPKECLNEDNLIKRLKECLMRMK